MSHRKRRTRHTVLLLALATTVSAVAACSTKRVDEEPIMGDGDRVSVPDGSEYAGGSPASAEEARLNEITARAMEECQGETCDAIVRGEVVLGMTEAGVLAATRTTEEAWQIRHSGPATVLTPASRTHPPSDRVSDVAMVRLAEGGVRSIAYQESQGLRLVNEPGDATVEGRAAATAEALVEEGIELAAAGDFDRALNRFDRADILQPDDPMIDYRIATVLDKQLRPIQALIQYRLFLHQLELERIEARGDAAAKLADAIAQARQRVIILERQTQ